MRHWHDVPPSTKLLGIGHHRVTLDECLLVSFYHCFIVASCHHCTSTALTLVLGHTSTSLVGSPFRPITLDGTDFAQNYCWISADHCRKSCGRGLCNGFAPGAVSMQRCLTSKGIPVFKIRRSRDRLIFNMGILISGKDGPYIETGL